MDNSRNDLDRLHKDILNLTDETHEIYDQVTLLRIDVAKLNVELSIKAGIWGLVAGTVPVVIVLAINFLKGSP